MRRPTEQHLPPFTWLTLLFLLVFRLITYALTDVSVSGDGVSYIKSASYIGIHGLLPPLSMQPNAYAWLLSWFHVHKNRAAALQEIGQTQQLFDFVIIIILCWLAYRFVGQSQKLLIPAWILIVLQPFTGIWSHTIYSEQAVTFFSFTGFLLLSIMVCNNRSKRIAQVGLIFAGLALGFASILRSDVFALNTVLLFGLVIYLSCFAGNWLAWRKIKIASLVLAYIAVPLLMASYQYRSSGEFGLFNNKRQHEGYFAWVRTWPATPKEYETFAFFSGRDSWSANLYPNKAFDSQEEKQAFAKIMEEWKQLQLRPSSIIDDRFKNLADEKVKKNPIRHYFVNPIRRIYYYWFNNDGAQFYTVPYRPKRPFSTIIVAAVSVARLMLIALFLMGASTVFGKRAWEHGSSRSVDWLYLFSGVACLYVVLRTLELGVLSAWMIAGLMELRFISIAMPFFIVGALLGARTLANRV